VRKTGGDPADPKDGTQIASGATITSASDTGLTSGTTYHYAVWTIAGLLVSAPTRTTATPGP
jgi:hypothetical protein